MLWHTISITMGCAIKTAFLLHFCLLHLAVSAVEDFTCVTKPRVIIGPDISDVEGTYIAAFHHGESNGVTFSFKRSFDTFTGEYRGVTHLPAGSEELQPTTADEGTVTILTMPRGSSSSQQRQNIGAFACTATESSDGRTSEVGIVIMSKSADFLPTHASLTVNRGEAVNLSVSVVDPGRPLTRWRVNGGDVEGGRNDHLYYQIASAIVANTAVYEAHFMGERGNGNQALMRLNVRDCPKDKWRAPSCDQNCPVCFNGGVCADDSGVCICSPGFSGQFCEILLGPDRFGQNGSFRCSSYVQLGTTSTCSGELFCLPDPFGCTCASGYHGIDCETECTDGSFGANCAQSCHCENGVACDKTTGRCPGNCSPGYKGINCQDNCPSSQGGAAGYCLIPCTSPAAVSQLSAVSPTDSSIVEIHVSWKMVSNRCAVSRYRVQYQLTYQEQCLIVGPEAVDISPDNYYADSLVISTGLLPYSTYVVHVSAWNEIGQGPVTSYTVQTQQAVPRVAPVFKNTSPVETRTLGFSWNPIPCGFKGGVITGYTYEVRDKETGTIVSSYLVTTLNVAVTSLTPCTDYIFRVQAHTSVGPGPWMDNMTVATLVQAPAKVEGLTATGTSVTTDIQVDWLELEGNCPMEYVVEYALLNRDLCDVSDTESLVREPGTVGTQSLFVITELHPYSFYRVFVRARNSAGVGPEASTEILTHSTAPTGPPSNITVTNVTLHTLSFSWDRPLCGFRNGDITRYRYNLTSGAKSWHSEEEMNSTHDTPSVDFTELDASTLYTFTVSAGNDQGYGPALSITERTIRPGKPESLVASTVTQTSVTLEWTPPLVPQQSIVKYVIEYRVIGRPYDRDFIPDPESGFESRDILSTSAGSGMVDDLEPSTHYEFHVYIVVGNNIPGERVSLRVFTAPATDLPQPEKPSVSDLDQPTGTSVTFTFGSMPSISKYISAYQVGVKKTVMATNPKRSRKSVSDFRHYAEDPASYVAAELPQSLPEEFVVGDGQTYVGFYNPSLQEGAEYEIYISAVSRINETIASVVWNDDPLTVQVRGSASPQESNSIGIGLGTTLAILLTVAVILGALVLWKRRQRAKDSELQDRASGSAPDFNMVAVADEQPSGTHSSHQARAQPESRPHHLAVKPIHQVPAKDKEDPEPACPSHEPIPLASLADYIKSKKSTKSGFQTDYESLPTEQLYSWTVAKKEENKKKNRYTNIVAYDHSRVVLECLDDDPHSDYINAAYIHGYQHQMKYIASQGPNKSSVEDVWRMVWQENVGIIVMLTNLRENGKLKCEKYWPDDSMMYGHLCVTKADEHTHTNYTVRTFHLSKITEPEGVYRVVTQYHYTTWPDMKPPESSALLQFVRRVQASETQQPGPIVVHCSAGVGRTGTYITLDAMLQQAQAEGQVDVYNFVSAMRHQRIQMVQTLDQYKFIFDALLESCLSGNTAIPSARLHQDYAKLKRQDRKTGTTGMEDQFHMLETFSAEFSADRCRGGRKPANVDKNRFRDVIPVDKNRPYLMTAGEEGSTDYINATFLDGYKEKAAYLATQAPLPNTMGDIWRMVFDYHSTCIVMLNEMDNDPSIPQYWPEEGIMTFGPLTVESKGIDSQNDAIVIRHFGLINTDRKKDGEKIIRHIQYRRWPAGKEVPDSPSSLLKVLEAVRLWRHDQPDGPVTVHCIDGLGRSGTFCALMTILNQVCQEQVLDVFQAVKKLRAARAGMVQTLAQYQLCYQVTQDYIDNNSVYENLR